MRLLKLIRKFAAGKSTLLDRIRSLFDAEERREYTLPHIVQKVSPAPVEDVAAALAELTRKQEIEKVLRVESPANAGGIGDFSNVQDIPDQMYDFRSDRTFFVRPENITVIFRRRRTAR